MSDIKSNTRIDSAVAHDLNSMIDYAEGSTVSRILYKGDRGSLTLFSFDKNQSLSEHSAPFDAIVQVIDGSVELTIGGEKIEAVTGQLVVMPANIPHGLYAVEKFKMLLTMIRDKEEKEK